MTVLAVVTGGSAGLGRAVLAGGPRDSYRVDVSRSGPPDIADGHVRADLADPSSWSRVAEELGVLLNRRVWERVVVVHNAGTLEPIGFAGEVDSSAYLRAVLLDAAAPQVLGHHLLRELRVVEAPRDLVMISSGASSAPYPGWSSYGAGKAAVDQWVRTVGAEQQRRGGVRVVSVSPGVVATGMQDLIRRTSERDFPEVERFRALHREGRLLEPDEVARRLWAMLDDRTVASGDLVGLHRYA